jgi:hypothetical protein
MKTFFFKPGFELIFSLSLVIILGLPPVLLAQTTKALDIKIENGDTTINGKNIKQLSAADRETALTDISHINSSMGVNTRHKYSFKHRDSVGDGHTNHMEFHRRENGSGAPMLTESFSTRDSMGNMADGRAGKFHGQDMRMDYKRRMDDDMANGRGFSDRNSDRPFRGFDRRNTQNFDYVNVDNNGVSTHINFHVAEASNADLKRMPHIEGARFEIKDLNLVPEFSTGKTLLMFNLASKAPAEVKLSDSEGKLVWSDKTVGGNFSKSFALGLNGVYYLQIKQGGSFALRKIMKEE